MRKIGRPSGCFGNRRHGVSHGRCRQRLKGGDHESPPVVMPAKWDLRFLELAHHISQWSKDPSTKVGCVVVGSDREIRSTGFNGFPRGIEDSIERLEDREEKYPLICHAEENAIMHAARIGVSLKDCTAYVTWPPCTRCARSLIQAGIVEVVYAGGKPIPERWVADFNRSTSMMQEAGLKVRDIIVD